MCAVSSRAGRELLCLQVSVYWFRSLTQHCRETDHIKLITLKKLLHGNLPLYCRRASSGKIPTILAKTRQNKDVRWLKWADTVAGFWGFFERILEVHAKGEITLFCLFINTTDWQLKCRELWPACCYAVKKENHSHYFTFQRSEGKNGWKEFICEKSWREW